MRCKSKNGSPRWKHTQTQTDARTKYVRAAMQARDHFWASEMRCPVGDALIRKHQTMTTTHYGHAKRLATHSIKNDNKHTLSTLESTMARRQNPKPQNRATTKANTTQARPKTPKLPGLTCQYCLERAARDQPSLERSRQESVGNNVHSSLEPHILSRGQHKQCITTQPRRRDWQDHHLHMPH
jgi:hypothetical protein